jgi:hypothetical protein
MTQKKFAIIFGIIGMQTDSRLYVTAIGFSKKVSDQLGRSALKLSLINTHLIRSSLPHQLKFPVINEKVGSLTGWLSAAAKRFVKRALESRAICPLEQRVVSQICLIHCFFVGDKAKLCVR